MKERKSLYSSISGWGMFLAGVLLLTACADDEIIESPAVTGDGISFSISKAKKTWEPDQTRSAKPKENPTFRCEDPNGGFSIDVTTTDGIDSYKPDQQPQSRGTQITEKNENWGYKVGAYYYIPNQTAPVDYFDENSSGGYSVTTSTETVNTDYYWPPAGSMKFFAVAPANITGFNAPTAENIATPTLTYTIPAVVADQKDIMVAQPATIDLANRTSAQVGLQFEHLLAAVQFKMGDMLATRINSIKISGVIGGKVSFTYSNGNWILDTTEATEDVSYSPSLSYIDEDGNTKVVDTSTLDNDAEITGNKYNSMMMVIPQTISGAKLTVNYTELLVLTNGVSTTTEKTITLPEHTWKAGKTTSYNISIGSSLNVTIPEVTNQDAHYVMVPMYYNLSNVGDVSNLTASVEYTNNTATSNVTPSLLLGYAGGTEVTSIDKCTGLSTLQRKGYWTESKVTINTTIKDGVESSTEPSDPVNIRGGNTLPLNENSSGTIVMFLPENNGKTNREVILRITGTYDGKTITIGSRSFIQLCPNWKEWTDSENNVKYIGIERIEESYGENDDKLYPFGFKYNRVVTYTNNTLAIRVLYSNAIESLIGVTVDNNTAVGEHKIGNGFITYTVEEGYLGTGNFISKIVLNYGVTNNLGTNANNEDGLTNTKNLFHFTGGINLAELETSLDSYVRKITIIFVSVDILKRTISSNSTSASSDYAAFTAMKKNRFSEIEEIIDDQDQNIKEPVYTPTIADSDIEWFLPSREQASTISDTGEYIMTGSYWTSTSLEDGTNTKAWYYSFTNAGVNSGTATEDRITPERKVRSAIYWKGSGSPLTTTE